MVILILLPTHLLWTGSTLQPVRRSKTETMVVVAAGLPKKVHKNSTMSQVLINQGFQAVPLVAHDAQVHPLALAAAGNAIAPPARRDPIISSSRRGIIQGTLHKTTGNFSKMGGIQTANASQHP